MRAGTVSLLVGLASLFRGRYIGFWAWPRLLRAAQGAPSGRHLAALFSYPADQIEVRGRYPDPVLVIAERPLGVATPADLVALEGSEQDDDEVAGLLRACLVHRFGSEVALGEGDVVGGAADDIAL